MGYLTKMSDIGVNRHTLAAMIAPEIMEPATSFSGTGKKSFLVFKNNKYTIVPTSKVAYFYIKCTSSVLVTFDEQEYFVNYSLDHIQEMLHADQFYRLNRQYLINFGAVKDVEHYFARKLLVNLAVPIKDKLLVSKEKARSFLDWLENR